MFVSFAQVCDYLNTAIHSICMKIAYFLQKKYLMLVRTVTIMLFFADVEEIYDNPVDLAIYDTPADPVIYETLDDPPLFRTFEPDTSENMAYGVLQGVPTTSNPAYGQVRR